MRMFVESISAYAKTRSPGFIVIPQNGEAIVYQNDETTLDDNYLAAIDGLGKEELYYGYDNNDDAPTGADITAERKRSLVPARDRGKRILVTD